MKYCAIKKYDVANGPGVRVSIFVSGCNHHCKGCFNEEAWDFNYGNDFNNKVIDEIIEASKSDYISGLSLLGGEPFEHINQIGLLKLVKRFKKVYPNKDIWAYTGYLFDKDIIGKMFKTFDETREFLSYIDVLVDGKFVLNLKNPNLYFRGSSNQRIIDVKESLKEEMVVIHEIQLNENLNKSIDSNLDKEMILC